jgi:hypothetical protein
MSLRIQATSWRSQNQRDIQFRPANNFPVSSPCRLYSADACMIGYQGDWKTFYHFVAGTTVQVTQFLLIAVESLSLILWQEHL